MTFEEVVAEWMRANEFGFDVQKVVSCDGVGDDWHGSTAWGFGTHFGVAVAWLTSDGTRRNGTIEGEDMQSLWMHVVGAWSNDA